MVRQRMADTENCKAVLAAIKTWIEERDLQVYAHVCTHVDTHVHAHVYAPVSVGMPWRTGLITTGVEQRYQHANTHVHAHARARVYWHFTHVHTYAHTHVRTRIHASRWAHQAHSATKRVYKLVADALGKERGIDHRGSTAAICERCHSARELSPRSSSSAFSA